MFRKLGKHKKTNRCCKMFIDLNIEFVNNKKIKINIKTCITFSITGQLLHFFYMDRALWFISIKYLLKGIYRGL